jgi:acetyltransferase-like isoleucine patch superfamily enzyme
MAARVHPTSLVSETAQIGDETQIWLFCQIRDNVRIGRGCIFGKGVYVDTDVTIGDNVKVQNNASIFTGVTIEDGVFVGPHVCFTNDKVPRAVNPDMSRKGLTDWHITATLVKAGAAIGANATVVCGVTIGRWAMVASGSVVTKSVPDHALVIGNPARFVGWVCACG